MMDFFALCIDNFKKNVSCRDFYNPILIHIISSLVALRVFSSVSFVCRFQDEEVSSLMQLLTWHPTPSMAGVRFVSLGLCVLIACPSLIATNDHEKKAIEWVQWLVHEEAYFKK